MLFRSDKITISFKNSPNDFVTIAGVSTDDIINDNNIIENFEFENGDRLSFEDIKKLSLIGSNENETLIGYNNSHNTIKGNGGDDRIYGGNLGDTIYGGYGNDYIESKLSTSLSADRVKVRACSIERSTSSS